MSAEMLCFLLGSVATVLWFRGIWMGVMPGWKTLLFASGTGLVRRSADGLGYWIATAVVGCLVFGLLVIPVITWVGLRR